MMEPDPTAQPARPSPRARVSWAAVIGFGTLALLWPLLRLVGMEAVVGELLTAVLAFVLTFLVWALGAGLGYVPRPILTLALSGVVFSLVLTTTLVALGELPEHGWGLFLVAAVIEACQFAAFGAIAGVVAHVLQGRKTTGR